MEVPRIEARRVGREAGRLRLLTSVTLHALRGEVVALVGPSGAGKSTLLRCLNGYTPPDSGSVLYGAEDLYADRTRFCGAIGSVPQDDVVHGALTVHASLTYALRLRRPALSADEVEARATAVTEQLDLTARRDTKVEKLSGGQRKRVSLGMELVASPAVLFLDEPTSGLDPALEEKMTDLFRTIAAERRIVVVTTHVMDSLAKVEQLAVLYAGHLAFFGPPVRALAWFAVGEPTALFKRLPERAPAEWAALYADSADARSAATRPPPGQRAAAAPSPPSTPESALAEIERELAAMKEARR